MDTPTENGRIAPPLVPAATVTLISPPRLGSARRPSRGLPLLWVPAIVAAGALLIVLSASGGPLLLAMGLVIFVATVGLGALCYAALWWGPKHTLRVERDRYLRYVDDLRQQLGKAARGQRDAASWSHPAPDQLLDVARSAGRRFERRPGDADFGQVRVGLGTVDLALRLRDEIDPNPLTASDPIALAAATDLRARPRTLLDMPVTADLGAGITTVVGDPDSTRELARTIICQTAALHDPVGIRIALARHVDNVGAWEWVKWLPQTEVVTDRVSEVADLLADQVAARLVRRRGLGRPAGVGAVGRLPRLVVIVDAEKLPLHDLDFRSHGVGLLDLDIHLIHLVADDAQAPRQIDQRIQVGATDAEVNRGELRQTFRPDRLSVPFAHMVARQLATRAGAGDLARTVETSWLPSLRSIGPATDEDDPWQQRLDDAKSLCTPFVTYERKRPAVLHRLRTPRGGVPTPESSRSRWVSPAPLAAGFAADPDTKPAASGAGAGS